jgi:hypothetical protein
MACASRADFAARVPARKNDRHPESNNLATVIIDMRHVADYSTG